MAHTNNTIIKHKAGLLNLAEELGNVSKACKVVGVSRDTFYRYQELVEDSGIDNPINKSRREPNPRNRVDEAIEQAVAYAIDQPAHGQNRTSNELRKAGVFVSGTHIECPKTGPTVECHGVFVQATARTLINIDGLCVDSEFGLFE